MAILVSSMIMIPVWENTDFHIHTFRFSLKHQFCYTAFCQALCGQAPYFFYWLSACGQFLVSRIYQFFVSANGGQALPTRHLTCPTWCYFRAHASLHHVMEPLLNSGHKVWLHCFIWRMQFRFLDISSRKSTFLIMLLKCKLKNEIHFCPILWLNNNFSLSWWLPPCTGSHQLTSLKTMQQLTLHCWQQWSAVLFCQLWWQCACHSFVSVTSQCQQWPVNYDVIHYDDIYQQQWDGTMLFHSNSMIIHCLGISKLTFSFSCWTDFIASRAYSMLFMNELLDFNSCSQTGMHTCLVSALHRIIKDDPSNCTFNAMLHLVHFIQLPIWPV